MVEIITALGIAPWYVVGLLFLVFIILLIVLIIPIVRLVLRKAEAVEVIQAGGVKVDLSKTQKGSKTVTTTATVAITDKTYKLILEAIEATIKDYSVQKTVLAATLIDEYSKKRELCVRNAIDGIRLQYQNKLDEKEAVESEQTDDLLRLFLEVEFGNTLREELVNLFKNPRITAFSEIEESDELKRITDACATKMSLTLRKYSMMLDSNVLKVIIGAANAQLRDTIFDTIKFFVKLTKKEQEDALRINKERIEEMEKKLQMILEVEAKEAV